MKHAHPNLEWQNKIQASLHPHTFGSLSQKTSTNLRKQVLLPHRNLTGMNSEMVESQSGYRGHKALLEVHSSGWSLQQGSRVPTCTGTVLGQRCMQPGKEPWGKTLHKQHWERGREDRAHPRRKNGTTLNWQSTRICQNQFSTTSSIQTRKQLKLQK